MCSTTSLNATNSLMKPQLGYYCNCVVFVIKPTNMYKSNRKSLQITIEPQYQCDQGFEQTILMVILNADYANECIK